MAAFRRAFMADRLAHAFIVAGAPDGAGGKFVDGILRLLFDIKSDDNDILRRIHQRTHPDIHWLEPESKSRVIVIDQIRDLNCALHRTATEDGWRVAVIRHADRLNAQASNALLKTLEEPGIRTMLLLVTDAAQELLPTIRSRCQWIVPDGGVEAPLPPWHEAVLSLLRKGPGRAPLDILLFAGALRDLLDAIAEETEKSYQRAEDEGESRFQARVRAGVLAERAQIMKMVLCWQRDVCMATLGMKDDHLYHFPHEAESIARQAHALSESQALQWVAAVEEMVHRLNRNLPPLQVFESGWLSGLAGRFG